MADVDISSAGSSYLADLKAARDRPAVLKIALTGLRASLPTTLIFAFEGIEDKAIYFSWISRISPKMRYEPFCCNGKVQLLQLLDMVGRDRNNLGQGVYFFADRDFDDLRGHPASAKLYMTDRYSVENYLVSVTVLHETLKNEFHCHAEPELRAPLLAVFQDLYGSFLRETRAMNLRLFQARRIGIELAAHLPDKISKIANVTLDSVSTSAEHSAEVVVRLRREPTPAEVDSLGLAFAELDGPTRYRGKFALLFFLKWLSLVADDRNASPSRYFAGVRNSSRANYHELTMASLAAKSELPAGLEAFVRSVAPQPA